MTTHRLKTWPEPFYATKRGVKPWEFRREDDRRFEVGDELVLREFDPATEAYSGEEMHFGVLFLIRGPYFGIPHGHVVMSLRPMDGALWGEPK